MMHLVWINPINFNKVTIPNYEKIIIKISKHKDFKNCYKFYFSNLYINYGYLHNYYMFSIYKNHKDITKQSLNKEMYVDKDVLYLYEDKTKAINVDYDFIEFLWNIGKSKTDKKIVLKYNKDFEENILTIKLGYLYDYLIKTNHQTKNLTELIKDIKYVNSNKNGTTFSENNLPKTILNEL